MPATHRKDIINQCVGLFEDCLYLEIGIADGKLFSAINAPRKVGVDPIPMASAIKELLSDKVQYFPVTSDLFFDSIRTMVDENDRPVRFDVVFIDGLHTYEQALQDVENALLHLSDNGIILMHDCKPIGVYCAMKNSGEFNAARREDPTISPAWTGDVYKVIVHLLASRQDLNVFTLDCDYGIGVVTKQPATYHINYPTEQINYLTYYELAKDFYTYLNLKNPKYFEEYFDERLSVKRKLEIQKKMSRLLAS